MINRVSSIFCLYLSGIGNELDQLVRQNFFKTKQAIPSKPKQPTKQNTQKKVLPRQLEHLEHLP